MPNVRSDIAQTALWGVAHNKESHYSEAWNLRLSCLHKPFQLPFWADCSAAFEDWYCWNKAPSPAGNSGVIYTGTELTTGEHIALFHSVGKRKKVNNVLPADGVVFGPGTGTHIAMVVERRPDLDHICASMGEEGDPNLVPVSVLLAGIGGPVTYLRFNTRAPGIIARFIKRFAYSRQVLTRP